MSNDVRLSPQKLNLKLRQIRDHLNLSQGAMLRALGFEERLFRSNISQYERGDREPPLLVLLSYARIAGITLEELFDDELSLNFRKP